MKSIAFVAFLLAALSTAAQSKPDEDAIRAILNQEIVTWNQGDSDGYSKHLPKMALLPMSGVCFSPDTRPIAIATRSS